MRKRLFIYCEGQTEEMIVERLIRNHLGHHGVKVERPELAATSLDPGGQRGGYLQRHELEALLLADMDAVERVFHRDKSGIQSLRQDIAGFANAEDINHGPATHPSARLASAIVGYENLKASNAYHVLANAGIEEGGIVRSKCPRFDTWLKHWENWGNER